MSRNILFFDTETNGFPPKARMTQLSWLIFSFEDSHISQGNFLIKPDGWEIPKTQFFIDNGHSTERSERLGFPVREAICAFCNEVNRCETEVMVAHNIDFDIQILAGEMKRLNAITGRKMQKVCTMKSWAEFKGGKWPKLQELHLELFGKEFKGAHDALADVIACKDIYFELVKRGVIK